MNWIEFIVDSSNQDVRLDVALSKHPNVSSRTEATKLIKQKYVFLNDNNNLTPKKRVQKEDIIRFKPFVPETVSIKPVYYPLDILFEDQYLIVINKPRNMVVHPSPGHSTDTLVNYLLYHTKLSTVSAVTRPGIVHRLDKDTSGILVVAKNNFVHENLAKQFANHTIERRYQAIVWGTPIKKKGIIEKPIGRHPKNRKKQAIVKHGKSSITYWKVIELFYDFSLIECELKTGRTHQIRVHLTDMGYPIVGDPIYGKAKKHITRLQKDIQDQIQQMKGQALHACHLSFIHPLYQKKLSFYQKVPDDMNVLIRMLQYLKTM